MVSQDFKSNENRPCSPSIAVGFPRAGIVEVGQKNGPSVTPFQQVVQLTGSTFWETAHTIV